jgi:2-iminobutanoate/2-iminopropanoate deaminase
VRSRPTRVPRPSSCSQPDLTHVVRVGIVMRALQRDRPVFNQVWAERFGEHRPARSAIEASDFGREGEDARFMVEVVAYRG